jgi:hypothetical protein
VTTREAGVVETEKNGVIGAVRGSGDVAGGAIQRVAEAGAHWGNAARGAVKRFEFEVSLAPQPRKEGSQP